MFLLYARFNLHLPLLQNGRLDPLSSTSNPGLIRLFCIRHGERVDFAFGPTWPESAFDKTGKRLLKFLSQSFPMISTGNYRRINLNMPMTLPRRRNPFRDFIGDSPITEIGASQARLTGEALAANDCFAQYCYSSPSLRCIQTAHNILQGMGLEGRVKIRIEPGLFEFLGWYERGLPAFFNPSEMIVHEDEETNLFHIDKNYRPIISLDKLSRDEKYLDYYNRSFKVTQQITDKHKLTGKSQCTATQSNSSLSRFRCEYIFHWSCRDIGSLYATIMFVCSTILFGF